MRTLTRRVAALAIVSTLTLAGCGGGDGGSDDTAESDTTTSETAPADDVEPADGDTISSDAFEFSVPEGWKDSSQATPGALVLAADTTDDDGFSDNVNVISDDTVAGADREQLEDSVEKVLKGVNAKDVQVKDPTRIDGEEAVRVGAIFEQNGTKYRTEQYAVAHDDKGYVVTFSFSEDVPEADRDAVADSVLTTWKWAS